MRQAAHHPGEGPGQGCQARLAARGKRLAAFSGGRRAVFASRRRAGPAAAHIAQQEARHLPRGRAWLEIDLAHLHHNAEEIERALPQGCALVAAVKANAYGHGDVEVARTLNRAGVRAFAVATAEEGARLRRHGIKGEILILGYTHPEEFADLVRYDLVQTVVDADYASLLDRYGRPMRVHVKIDTGMHRLGEGYDRIERIRKIYACKNLSVEGIYTHLCACDSLAAPDVAFTREQIARFDWTVAEMRGLGYRPGKTHVQSTYGLLNYPELGYDYVRIGIALYGVLSGLEERTRVALDLQPVLSLRARIAEVREIAPGESAGYGRAFTAGRSTRIAVVTIGYADGMPRSLSCGRGSVLVNGAHAPVAGRICMDQTIVDVSGVPDVRPGDIVTIIGEDGAARISAEQVAASAGTITNELLSRLGGRLGRIYSD